MPRERLEKTSDHRCLWRRLGFFATKVHGSIFRSVFIESLLFYRPDHGDLVVRLRRTWRCRLENVAYELSHTDSGLGRNYCTYRTTRGCSLFNILVLCLYLRPYVSISWCNIQRSYGRGSLPKCRHWN